MRNIQYQTRAAKVIFKYHTSNFNFHTRSLSHNLISNPVHPKNTSHTPQTSHLKHIQLLSLVYFHSPTLRTIRHSRHNHFLIQHLLNIHSQPPEIHHPFHCTLTLTLTLTRARTW